jgi:hypothetical protein
MRAGMMTPARRGRLRRRVLRAAFVALMAPLAGCQTVTLSDLNPFGGSSEPQPCPPAAALADAVSMTEFGRGQSRDDSNIIYSARIEGTVFDCQVVGSQVIGRVGVVGTLTLGRKGKAGPVSLPIFVALTRAGTDVVSKRFDTVEFEIERGATTAQFEKAIPDYTFSLAGGESTLSYEILTGFNLTPEQIEYSRQRFGG